MWLRFVVGDSRSRNCKKESRISRAIPNDIREVYRLQLTDGVFYGGGKSQKLKKSGFDGIFLREISRGLNSNNSY